MCDRPIIILAHVQYLTKWEGPWIYIGRSYIKMKRCNDYFGTNQRISLAENFRFEFEANRVRYINWIEEQRKANDDSLEWWMSHLAGKNNMCSIFFDTICQIMAFDTFAQSIKSPKDLLIVCEDAFIAHTINANCKRRFNITYSKGFKKGEIYDWCLNIYNFTVNFSFSLIRCVQFWYWARETKSRRSDSVENQIFLIQQCLDTKSFLKEGKLWDRYFTLLPGWIESKGYKVVRLPWLYNVELSLKEIFLRLRKDDCLVIEDYLVITDYFIAVKKFILSIFSLKKDIQYAGFTVRPLLLREQIFQSLSQSNIRFWLHQNALRRWSSKFSQVTYIDTFEMMPAEHIPVNQLKKSVPKFIAIGYYHSLVSRDFLGYWFPELIRLSSVFPDKIVTNGSIGKLLLKEQGLDPEIIKIGPALRQQFVKNMDYSQKKGILLLCPLEIDTACEAIFKLYSALLEIKDLEISIQVKAHPMMNKRDINSQFPNNELPKGWEWNDSEISIALKNVYCCVSLATASAYDAILHGCIVIPLQRELASIGNFLDCLQNEFPVLREVAASELSNRIKEVVILKREFFFEEFEKIHKYLKVGLNPVDEDNLQVFLN